MHDQDSKFGLTEPRFLALLVKYEPALRAYARCLVPDWDLVDEALQEDSVTMWRKRDQLMDAAGFVPWAKVILRFKCLSQLEKLRARRPLLSDEILEILADRGVWSARRINGNDALISRRPAYIHYILSTHVLTSSKFAKTHCLRNCRLRPDGNRVRIAFADGVLGLARPLQPISSQGLSRSTAMSGKAKVPVQHVATIVARKRSPIE